MQTYEVTFTWRGERYAETVEATSYFAARRLVESRYPSCSIWHVREI